MPLPFILAGAAIAAGIGGVGAGINGGVKMKEAKDTMEHAKSMMERAQESVEENNKKTLKTMDKIGKRELEVLSSFKDFSDLIEKIQGRPEFKNYSQGKYDIPEYNPEDLKNVSVGAGVLLGGLGGAAVGTAGGFAAAGATTSAVMALGTASTGTAISTLSGAAATNATLAALGGGAISAGGGGMALGTAVLGGATLGVGLLVGGIIFNFTGSKMSDKADDAYRQAKKAQEDAERIINYLNELNDTAKDFYEALNGTAVVHEDLLMALDRLINRQHKVKWVEYSNSEKMLVQNSALIVGVLYKVCQTKIVKENKNKDDFNEINKLDVRMAIKDCQSVVEDLKAS